MIHHHNRLSQPNRAAGKRHPIAAPAGRAACVLVLAGLLAGQAAAAPAQHKKQRHGEAAKRAVAEKPPTGPLTIIVSIATQRVSLYANGEFVARGPVSTGTHGHPTPIGVFTVIQKDRHHRSNIYSGAPMPYMQRITWSGVAIHQGVLPGHPASHGCIRTSNDFAIRLWGITNLGTRVIVSRSDVVPAPISNARLFALSEPIPQIKPEPAVMSTLAPPAIIVPAVERTSSDPADSSNPLELKGTDEAAASVAEQSGPAPIDAAKAGADAAMLAEAPRQPGKISVFVSKKTGRLYVRYNNQALFDVPVAIRDPERPIGTHVFTALAVDKDWKSTHWSVVTMPGAPAPRAEVRRSGRKARHNRQVETPEPPRSAAAAADALTRIEMPREAVERISEMLTPGASLIISDQPMSNETTKSTDFIVLTH